MKHLTNKAGHAKKLALIGLFLFAGQVPVALAQVDTDGDGFEDSIDAFPLDPTEWLDNDNDGLGNNLEAQIGTSPDNPDSDGDSLSDQFEYTRATTDPRRYDTDSDGLWDDEEPDYGTDPQIDDSDGDGVLDGTEVAAGSDPTDPTIAYERQWVIDWERTASRGSCCSSNYAQNPLVDISASGSTGLQHYDAFYVDTTDAPITFFSRAAENGTSGGWLPSASALSLDGEIWAEVSTTGGSRLYLRTNQTSDNANDRRILPPIGGYFLNWIDLDEDGDTLAVYHSTGKTYVYRWTGFQWISKGLPLTGDRAKLSTDGDSLILQSGWDVKRYLWTGQTWSEVSSDAIGTNNYLTDATTDLQYIATIHAGYDIVSPETFDVGGAQVYNWSGATYDTLGNFIDGQTSNFNLNDAHVSETGGRLLVTNRTTYREYLREGDRWRFVAEFLILHRPSNSFVTTANLNTLLSARGGRENDSTSHYITLQLLSLDADGDGFGASVDAFPTDPAASVDTDGDGMPDAWNEGYTEADSTTGLVLDPYPTQTPDEVDRDFDGVTDSDEAVLGTDPDDPDSDDDGFTDGEEVDAGTNPLDASVFPQPSISLVSLSEVYLSEPITIDVTVTDPLSVSSVKLYFRKVGDATYSVLDMTAGENDLYSGQVPAVFVTAAGVEYYIIATNPRVSGYLGSFTLPNLIPVDTQPVMLSVDPPEGLSTGGTVLSLEGHNFALGMTLSVGGNNCVTTAYVSSQLMRCTTPPGVPGIASVGLSTSGGDEYVLPAAFSYVGSQAEFRILTVGRGSTDPFDVPVLVNALSNLTSFVASITYDPARLQFNGVTLAEGLANWTFSFDSNTPGQVTIAMTSAVPYSVDGLFMNLNFTPLQLLEEVSPISFSNIQLNDGAIPTLVFAGGYYYTPTYTLSGSVTHRTAAGTGLSAEVSIDDLVVATTDPATGDWSAVEVPSGARTVTADVLSTENEAIRAADASRILRHLIGDSLVDAEALAAADVNGSGTITAQDATQILQYVAGSRALPFDGQLAVWQLSPSEIDLDVSADTIDQDFVGILMGDVTGNWTAATPRTLASVANTGAGNEVSTSDGQVISLEAPVTQGSEVRVDFNLHQDDRLVEAIEMSFALEGNATFGGVENVPGDWQMTVNEGADSVSVVLAGASYLDLREGDQRVQLIFNTTGDRSTMDSVRGWINEASYTFGDFATSIVGDRDGDSVPDDEDAFPDDATESVDTDGDGTGNNADTDDDNDGVPDAEDAFPLDASESADADGDGVGDNADACDNTLPSEIGEIDAQGCAPSDIDTDGDGYPDVTDAFPNDPTEWLDSDNDGWGDNIETEMGSDPYDASDVPVTSSLQKLLPLILEQQAN